MSTFNGIVCEFPRIRIDYFRQSDSHLPPLAGFLSHVHSDHLAGLESLKSPFIYCSYATRELLLKIEKYPHRINFTKGILESRVQHYRELKKLLRPIPLHAPTEIELTPHLKLRVTLFDANHCPGAVMFLIEGDGRAILYTGDVRAEPWFVNALVRQPVLIPYTLGKVRLDKIYLDTTFAAPDKLYEEFPSKAEGLRELLEAVSAYSHDTIFQFKAWTLGYEDVWAVLASYLKTHIHVDRYFWQLFESLSQRFDDGVGIPEAPLLLGFQFGNHRQEGCLTVDPLSARIHSCDSGASCPGLANRRVVSIIPIITRDIHGVPVPEVGAGGGFGDLQQSPKLELLEAEVAEILENTCLKEIEDAEAAAKIRRVLFSVLTSRSKILHLEEFAASAGEENSEEISLRQLLQALSSRQQPLEADPRKQPPSTEPWKLGDPKYSPGNRPEIQFPYSRHSSYFELCALVGAFRPREIHPCTVDEATWTEEVSMQALFGHLCSGNIFTHDREMYRELGRREAMPARKKVRRSEVSPVGMRGSSQVKVLEYAGNSVALRGGEHDEQDGMNVIANPERTLEMIRAAFVERG